MSLQDVDAMDMTQLLNNALDNMSVLAHRAENNARSVASVAKAIPRRPEYWSVTARALDHAEYELKRALEDIQIARTEIQTKVEA